MQPLNNSAMINASNGPRGSGLAREGDFTFTINAG
jgi:hypothetical protein